MTGKEFLNAVSNGRTDAVTLILRFLERTNSAYCLIGGLAVNAYAEPVVSLDLDLIVVADKVDALCQAAYTEGIHIQRSEHSINLSVPGSDLRIQLQTDPRYQNFISRATPRKVLGYELSVAAVEDVLRGKIWAYGDKRHRKSKRHRDLADILRLVETHPYLKDALPAEIRSFAELPGAVAGGGALHVCR